MKNLAFYLGVGLIFTHELDAMLNNEWRVLPLTSWLGDEYGQLFFLLAHVPIFAILVALIASTNAIIRNRTRAGVSVFLVLHGILHAAFLMNENYEFESMSSNILIFGAATCGIVFFCLNISLAAKST